MPLARSRRSIETQSDATKTTPVNPMRRNGAVEDRSDHILGEAALALTETGQIDGIGLLDYGQRQDPGAKFVESAASKQALADVAGLLSLKEGCHNPDAAQRPAQTHLGADVIGDVLHRDRVGKVRAELFHRVGREDQATGVAIADPIGHFAEYLK